MGELNEYLALRYTIVLRRDAEGDFVAKVQELPGCSAHGKTGEEALENLDEAKKLWIQDCLENGDPVPLPEEEDALPSGKWLQRVPRRLHRKLQSLAKAEGVSLNQLVTAVLAEAVGERKAIANQPSQMHAGEVYNLMWSNLSQESFGSPDHQWHVRDVTPSTKRSGTLAVSRTLEILSSRLPDTIELPLKARKDAEKRHASFEVS